MYTYAGDATLDGKINVDDYTRIDFNISLGSTGWFNGDFNYDGKINVDDYTIIDFNVGLQGAPFLASSEIAGTQHVAGLLETSAVPEPSATLLIAFATISTIRRRRRD
jgi:hypothetical protein